jgi:hypothetical protein
VVVELIIPPPPPELETQSQSGARRAARQMSDAGTANATLPPATDSMQAARAHVDEPTEETASRAQGALTAALSEQPTPSPEIEQLCDDIQDAIENRRPVDEDSLRQTDPETQAQEVGTALNDDITEESNQAAGEYENVNAPPEGTPEQLSAPLPDTPASVPTPAVNASAATPPAVPAEDVSLEADVAATQGLIEEAGMDSEVAGLIDTGPVAEARSGMGELEEVAARDPAEVLREQEEAIASSEEAMRGVEASALAALEASRGGTVAGTFSQQLALAGSEEEQRLAAATAAETIYTTARDAVNDQLEPMVTTAMEMWNTGKDRIATAFDTELQEAKRLVDERHEGIDGAVVSLWDDVAGLPTYITDIYTRAERTFGRDICALIRRVSTYVNGIVLACEEIIDNADRQIETIFSQLPESLQGWASEQQAGFDQQLNELRDNVHDTQQNFTDDLVAQAGDAVQEARERIHALREAAKGAIQKVADAIQEFRDDPVRFLINGLLAMVGIAPPAFWALLVKIEQAAQDIADDPVGFGSNLLAALRLGFDNFFGNFFGHLLSGFINWLFSAMGTVGVELPPDTSLKSIITFFLQVMGITWPNIRIILVRHVGERNVELLEKAYELITLLIEEGPGGIFEMIKERLDPAQIMNTIIEAAVSYMVEAIVSIATVRILGLFNPVGAIFQAMEAIYKVLKWVFENAARIFTLVETVVNGIVDIIAGNIAGMAEKTERALAGMLVPVIDFIAGFLGLGDLPEKIAEVVGGFQAMVLSAIDSAIGFLVARARALLQSLGIGGADEEEGADAGALDDEVGKTVRFSAGGEGHRLWIDTAGSGVEVMVASQPTPLSTLLNRWNGRVGSLDESVRGDAQTLLNTVSEQNGITLREAQEADDARDAAEGEPQNEEQQERAAREDDQVEELETQMTTGLGRLFDIFEGGAPFREESGSSSTPVLQITICKGSDDKLSVRLRGENLLREVASLQNGPLGRTHHGHGLTMLSRLLNTLGPLVETIENVAVTNDRILSEQAARLGEWMNALRTALRELDPTVAVSFAHLATNAPEDIDEIEVTFPQQLGNSTAIHTEYDRQLELQQGGINRLLIDQWILHRNAYALDTTRLTAIDDEEARVALTLLKERAEAAMVRARSRKSRYEQAITELEARIPAPGQPLTGPPPDFTDIELVTGRFGTESKWRRENRAGVRAVLRELRGTATGWDAIFRRADVLHNADQIAGGFGEIPPVARVTKPPAGADQSAWQAYLAELQPFVGSSNVNRSIGSLWSTRIDTLEQRVRQARKPEGWGIWRMKVKLRRI